MAKIELDIWQLNDMLRQAARAGAAECERLRNAECDRLKQRQAKRLLSLFGYKPGMLARLVENGLVHGSRAGEKKNSPIYYSRSEIYSAIGSLQMNNIINNLDTAL